MMISDCGHGRDDEVSELYEEHPYPDHGVVSRVVARMLVPTVRHVQRERGRRHLRVVDIGCGTGEQTCGLARAFPEVDVRGIDRNATSVAIARKLATKHGLSARFEAGCLPDDIPDLRDPDIIVMIGLLHHLSDPVAALRGLADVTKPGTTILTMLYGSFGNARRLRVRDALDLLAGSASREDRLTLLRDGGLASNTSITHHLEVLTRRIRFGPDISPIETFQRTLGGRSPAYQADYYTHPQESVYTWNELAELLNKGGWEFVGWPRRSGMPDQPEQIARGRATELLKAMSRLQQASVYERLIAPFLLYGIGQRGASRHHS